MKEFNIQNNPGEILIHLDGDNSNYSVTYDHGKLVFQNGTRKYNIPKNVGHKIQYNRKDPNTNKIKYVVNDIRAIYRDTTPTDFGITNKTDVALSSSHFTEELIVNGINEYIPVIAPAGVKIYVNNVIVPSGTLIDNGDKVKFELIASNTNNTTLTFNLAVGDISKTVSLKTIANIIPDGVSTVGLDTTKFSYVHFGNGGWGSSFTTWRTPTINEIIHDGVGDSWCRYYGNNQTVIYTPFDNSQIKLTTLGFWNNAAPFNPDAMMFNGKSFRSLGFTQGQIITLEKGYNVLTDTLLDVATNTCIYTRIS